MEIRPTQPRQIVQKPIQNSKSRDRRQSTSSSNSSTSESSERSQRDNYHRGQPIPPPRSTNKSLRLSQQSQTSNHHEQFQSKRPLPPTRSSYDLDKQERRRNRRRVASPNYEPNGHTSSSQPISKSSHPIHQHQVPHGRRRPLPPLPNV
ncbi:hypothetical protein I4U23_021091 [Adineta vaga]|nr:hypothetical protein I4U23_021091 [Adineta vaga]